MYTLRCWSKGRSSNSEWNSAIRFWANNLNKLRPMVENCLCEVGKYLLHNGLRKTWHYKAILLRYNEKKMKLLILNLEVLLYLWSKGGNIRIVKVIWFNLSKVAFKSRNIFCFYTKQNSMLKNFTYQHKPSTTCNNNIRKNVTALTGKQKLFLHLWGLQLFRSREWDGKLKQCQLRYVRHSTITNEINHKP